MIFKVWFGKLTLFDFGYSANMHIADLFEDSRIMLKWTVSFRVFRYVHTFLPSVQWIRPDSFHVFVKGAKIYQIIWKEMILFYSF